MIALIKLPRNYLQSYSILTLSEFVSGMLVPLVTLIFFSKVTPFFDSGTSEADKLWLYGIFVSVMQFAAMCANPIIGSISDQVGRKRSLYVCVAGILVLSIFAVLAVIFKNIWLLFIGYFTYNIVSATKVVCMASINDISQKHNKVLYVSLIQFFIGIGYMLGPLLSSYIAEISTGGVYFLWPFIAIGIGGILLSLVISFYFKDTYTPEASNNTGNKLILWFLKVREILKNKTLRFLVVLLVLDQAAWGGYYLFAPVVGKTHFNLSAGEIGLFVSLIGICLIIISGIVIPLLYRYFSHQFLLLVSCIMMLLGVGSSWLSLHFEISFLTESIYWVSLFPTLLGDVMIFSLVSAWMSNVANKHIQGNVAGFIYVVATLSWSLVGLASGYLAHIQLSNAYLLPVIATVLMCLYALIFREKFFKW
ncbi:MFS transporter [Thiotrichales bacterium 19S9-12]|nr:MFS transporter [Thiotrichales bacterium 19S9-11]MCF6811027.1 MFS transporter [Thiotrichales bacterium 19S9-12]